MKTFLLCVISILLSVSVFAQSDFKFYNDVSVPQTDAYNFTQHGEITPSLYTGTNNFSIPIYTYQDNDFKIPIALSYSSNGNKPNQRAGILGPGWNLEIGGCIAIETRGIPDYGRNMKNVPGFLALHDTTLLTSAQTDHWWRFMYQYDGAESGATCPQIVYTPNSLPTYLHHNEFDAEPDLFHFNFMGHSGSFHLDYDHRIVVYNTDTSPLNYKVDIKTHRLDHARDYSRIDTISITTSDGYIYLFTSDENSMDLNREKYSLWFEVISSWHLNRIIAPNGREVEFFYHRQRQDSYSPGSVVSSSNLKDNQYRPFQLEQFAYFPSEQDDPNKIIQTESTCAFLDSIKVGNQTTIRLTYSVMPYGDQYRKNVQTGTPLTTFSDTYRLTSLSVSYTKNSGGENIVAESSLSYTPNTNGGRTNYLTAVTIAGEGTYTMSYIGFNGALDYPYHGNINIDHYGYYNGTSNATFYPQTSLDWNTQEETIISANRTGNATYAQLGLISRLGYPTGGYTVFEYEPNDYTMVIKRPFNHDETKTHSPTLIRESGTTSGLRVKSVKSYLSNNTSFIEKQYTYADRYGSTGILTYIPRYSIAFSALTGGDAGTVTESATYKSSSLLSYGRTHIEYRNVTEHIRDSSRILYTFTHSALGAPYMDCLSLFSQIEEPFVTYGNTRSAWSITNSAYTPARVHRAVAPITSYQSVRGMPVDKVVYGNENSSKPLFWEHTEYDTSEYGTLTRLPCYLVRQFGLYGLFIGSYPIESKIVHSYAQDRGSSSTDVTTYTYNIYKEPLLIKQTLPSGDTLIRAYTHLRDLPTDSLNLNAVYATMMQRNLVSTTLSERIYLKHGTDSTLVDGRVCKYALFNGLVKPQKITRYYPNRGWQTEITFNAYDNTGNITQLTGADGLPVSYLWGFGGQCLLAQAVGLPLSAFSEAQVGADGNLTTASQQSIRETNPEAEIVFVNYEPGYGVSLLGNAGGEKIKYTYTQWRKLQNTINALSNAKIEKMDYSNEQTD